MMRSYNEIQMMVYKACRGAGFELAQAEDIGACLASNPDVSVFEDLLDYMGSDTPTQTMQIDDAMQVTGFYAPRDLPVILDAVTSGASGLILQDVKPDAFIAAMCAHCGCGYELQGQNLAVFAHNAANKSVQRGDVDATIWAKLDEFAARTYVPETDQSRLEGAGAGLTDND